MFSNFLKTAIRNLIRNKTFSFINIIGLAIGLAASIIIAMWVFDELSYDKFHEHSDNIYRVERDIVFQGQAYVVPVTGAVYGSTILKDYPEVIDMVRVDPATLSIEDKNKTRYNEMVMYVDTGFFNVFTFPLAKGDPETALKEPRSLILSQPAALKFFGDEDPINQVLRVDWDGEMVSYKITGVFEKLPANKHFQFDMISSFSTLEESYGEERLNTWVSNYLYTYVLLKEGTDKNVLERKFDQLVKDKILPEFRSFFKNDEEMEGSFKIFLRPITNIHLKAGLMWDIEVQGDIVTVYIFSVIALLILLIACFNFMSLSTALAGTRSLEVGIRKTVGSTRSQLIWQFIGESIITAFIAFIIALGIIQFVLPSFNTLTDKSLTLTIFRHLSYFLILAGIVLGTGFISGIYPAFYLSSVKPILVLKGRLREVKGKFSFRQILVVLQFTISIALIIGTLTALKQLNYVQNKPLGYDKENLMVLEVESSEVVNRFKAFKSDLLKNPMLESVASSNKVPAEREYSDSGWETDKQEDVFLSRLFAVNFDFFKTYKIDMAAGRTFNEDYSTDKNFKVIVNETAIKNLGYTAAEDAIGDKFHVDWLAENIDSLSKGQIIGVMKDFHFQSLRNKIEPLALFIFEDWMNRITIRYAPGKDKEVIQYVENTWNDHFPDVQFTYSFIQDYLTTFYKAEEKLQILLLIFTLLAIVIACLGLFGLAIFIAQQRIKEIGVRKAMGASISNIVFLLSKSFSKWVIIANILAWPLAWYFLNEWLSTFQYRIKLDFWLFVISGLLALIIALLTIMYRSYKAASRNPVDSLRYE